MERVEALQRIRTLIGVDLRTLAQEQNISLWSGGVPNATFTNKEKGWVGQTVERFLGLPRNSARAPNFGSWELKTVSLKHTRKGKLVVKETMHITMLDPVEVMQKSFEDSHVFLKLQKLLVVARIWEAKEEPSSTLYNVVEFDLDDPVIYAQVKADYDLIRAALHKSGFSVLTGKMGKLMQPRTKGQGHGSTSRAFYARAKFVAHMLGLQKFEP